MIEWVFGLTAGLLTGAAVVSWWSTKKLRQSNECLKELMNASNVHTCTLLARLKVCEESIEAVERRICQPCLTAQDDRAAPASEVIVEGFELKETPGCGFTVGKGQYGKEVGND